MTVAHFVIEYLCGAGGGEGAVWGNPGGNIAVQNFREKTEEKIVRWRGAFHCRRRRRREVDWRMQGQSSSAGTRLWVPIGGLNPGGH